jgi:hypothetical protein
MPRSKIAKKSIRIAPNKDRAPVWYGHENWTDIEFSKKFREAMQYYNNNYSSKDLKPVVVKWMTDNKYTKKQIQTFRGTKDWRCTVTMGAIASCLIRDMPPVREDFNKGRRADTWLRQSIQQVLIDGKYDIPPKEEDAKGLVISIQDRIRDASMAMTSEIEDAIESWQTNPDSFDPKTFKISNLLRGKQAKPAHARYIKEFYGRLLDELTELASGKADANLREAHSHIARRNIRKMIEFLQEIKNACIMLNQEAKVIRKVRKPKTVSKEKLIAKIKYKKTDETLKLVSIDPADIIGSKELWVYNTKARKLGKYVAAEFADLGIKGTTVTGFNETISVQKTIRKPDEKLKEFLSANKVALRKFLDTINATNIKLSGRINDDTILLKVV